jgi:hypothetical protein
MPIKSVLAGACAASITLLAFGAQGALGGAVAQDRSPDVHLARELIADASAFETYTRDAGAIQPGFVNPAAVSIALKRGAAHETGQLEAGMIAYAAMAALKEPAFVDGVRRAAGETESRDAMIQGLIEQPQSALGFAGSVEAASHIQAALAGRGAPLFDAGTRVKQAAYEVQHHAWSKASVAHPQDVLARIKRLSDERFDPVDSDTAHLFEAMDAAVNRPADVSAGPVVQRGLALAALAVIDAAGDDQVGRFQPLLSEPKSAQCLHMAKLNLFQCLAVARPHYEDIFCLGQHAMMDPGQCVADAAGGSTWTHAAQISTSAGLR